ncbi:MAG: hypothetical protein ABEJ34_07780 [Haloferacaceae archaeon]
MAVLAVGGGVTAPDLLVVWLAVPLVALLVTYVVMLGLGLWLPESGYFAGSVGAVLVFSLAVDGVGRALAVGLRRSTASPLVGPARAVLPRGALDPFAAVSATVWLRLALAVAVLGALAAVARRRPRAAEHTFPFALGGGLR